VTLPSAHPTTSCARNIEESRSGEEGDGILERGQGERRSNGIPTLAGEGEDESKREI
jgi:hypothetical protein